jgi:methylenetetrahydrofolate dehydrogenase (NADP+)/methenyltetrahydrofolate cyclohydrolase
MTTRTEAPRILDGKATARQIREEVADRCAELLDKHGIVPGLTVVLVGEDPASQIYVRNKEKAAKAAGMNSVVKRMPVGATQDEVLETIRKLNADSAVHGILVQLPLPEAIDEHLVIESIDPHKDVDGFHPENVGRLLSGLPGIVSCTPAGIIELLKRHDIPLVGKHAVVIGRSNIVGKPMAVLLLREHCTVTICHSRTKELADVASRGDLLIAAVGRRAMVTADFIKPGAVVVDVGMHRVEDEATCRDLYGDDEKRLATIRNKGATLAGDVHPLQARSRAGWLSPVPGGVGPLTIAMLLNNTIDAAWRAAERDRD